LSLELLHTFMLVVRNDGDASATAQQLGINQPSMSKRLSFLQHAGPVLERPWLMREGKSWKLTEEGAKVLPAVEEIVQRWQQLQEFIRQAPPGPQVAFACGQYAAATFVRPVAAEFCRQHPTVRLRIATLRGATRIERVANGSLDLALVSHDEGSILDIARRPLHVRVLFDDPLVLASSPNQEWSTRVEALPDRVKPRGLVGLPLILPEPDAGSRKSFDDLLRSKGVFHELDVVLQVGGWNTILDYVRAGLGVGVVSEAAANVASKETTGLIIRKLDPKSFTPRQVQLIARRKMGTLDQPDLSDEARAFHDALIRATARNE
jgi:DNA-binding transcriptional LysR family regulator